MPKPGLNFPTFTIGSLRGGRSAALPPSQLPDIQVVTASNIEFYQTGCLRKRAGSDAITLSGGTAFSSSIRFLFRHVAANTESAAELWAMDSAFLWKRIAGGATTWADITALDAATATDVAAVSFNGKLFLAYQSAQNRLHVWDGTTIRRTGLATPAAPTTGALVAGAVTDTRTYKVSWTVITGGAVVRRSELSAATAAVVMAGQQVPITRPTAPGEGESNWDLYAAGTNGIYYLIGPGNAIATATVNDNNANIVTASGGVVDPTVGTNTVLPSAKFLMSDGNRLLAAGGFSSPYSRIWFTPVLGDNNVGDDERYYNTTTQKNYIDLNENDGGAITGISPTLQGSIYVFKFRQIHKLTPTGDVDTPYLPYRISDSVGCISHWSIALGEDQAGDPALYFASAHGPYRLGSNGLEYLGRDVEDLWATLPLNAAIRTCHSVYDARTRQWWLWIAETFVAYPTRILVFNVLNGTPTAEGVRGGWSEYGGDLATAPASTLYTTDLSATKGLNLAPYCTGAAGAKILRAHSTSSYTDGGTTFRAFATTKAYAPAGDMVKVDIKNPIIEAAIPTTASSIYVRLFRDYTDDARSETKAFTASGETRLIRKYELALADCSVVQLTIGDEVAVASDWNIDRIIVPYEPQGER